MDDTTRKMLDDVFSPEREVQNRAYEGLIPATEQPVDWAYEAWDRLVAALKHKDNLVRAIVSQVLCNLAQSDPQNRMLKDFDALLEVTKDERFVTARHCLQAIWKVGLVAPAQRQMLLEGLARRYRECIREKNGTLIRHDIIVDLHTLYEHIPDAAIRADIRARALALIETEEDLKYRKKYAGVWSKEGAKG